MGYDFQVRQNLNTTVTVTELQRDIPASTYVHVYLVNNGTKASIGKANGVPAGNPLNIDVGFDVDPGTYEVEVKEEGGDIVYPTGLPEEIRVLPVKA